MNRFPLLVTLLFALPMSCQACATVSESSDGPIRIADESALIVWDAKNHTEHFVRRADFETKAKNFGFLVPTPSRPQLATANDSLFDDLEGELLPKTKTITQRGVNLTPFIVALSNIQGCGGNSDDTSAAANKASASDEGGPVEVLEQKRVGNYNASVLKASDTRSLLIWLRVHRYKVSPDTRQWLSPYLKAGFFLTAFQIVSDPNNQSAQAAAVRLTFKSDAPFYPYREPGRSQKVGGSRSLRVFYVGEDRVEGRIENKGRSDQWPAEMSYSAPVDASMLRAHGMEFPSRTLRLTAFEDDSSPRPGWGDLRFYLARNQSDLAPPPHIAYQDKRWWVPLDVLVIGLVFAIGCGARLHKRNSI